MSSNVVYRFPSGTQFRMGAAPKLGDTLRNDGHEWVVVGVSPDENGNISVTLRPVDGDPSSDERTASTTI